MVIHTKNIFNSSGIKSLELQNYNSINLIDKTVPIIELINVSNDNSQIFIHFNCDVSNNNNTTLTIDNFNIEISGGKSLLKGIENIIKTNNIYSIDLILDGLSNGFENIKITPKNIFYHFSNSSDKIEVSNIYNISLNNLTPPYISNTTLYNNNNTITIRLNENIVNKDFSDINKNNFELILEKGNAKLNSNTPLAIRNNFNLTYDIDIDFDDSFLANGSEILSIIPSNNILNEKLLPMDKIQVNNQILLNNLILPVMNDIKLAYDNSCIEVTFNKSVFTRDKNNISKLNFLLSIIGGNSKIIYDIDY